DLSSSKVLVLGAGEMAELAVQALRKRGVSHITVANRTLERADQLAERWQATSKAFSDLQEALESADILIASTGAPEAVVNRELVERVMQARADRPLVILDIAVPRNVEVSVGEISQVHLFDLDHLQRHLEGNISNRKKQITAVEAILKEELGSFKRWYSSLGIRPLIAELHQRAEEIRSREIDRTLQSLSHLGPHEQEQIHAMTRALVNKLLHAPITRLKQKSRKGSSTAYALVARDLFDLGESEIDPVFPHRRGK
ncbi:MAG: glutamyl-tRNA reductase, partial [Anaerolineales bacterium]